MNLSIVKRLLTDLRCGVLASSHFADFKSPRYPRPTISDDDVKSEEIAMRRELASFATYARANDAFPLKDSG